MSSRCINRDVFEAQIHQAAYSWNPIYRTRKEFFLKCLCMLKDQLQRFYKLVSYERAVKIPKNDTCITEIGQAVLEIFEFKVEFSRKIPKIRNFANVSIIRVEQ